MGNGHATQLVETLPTEHKSAHTDTHTPRKHQTNLYIIVQHFWQLSIT